MYSYKNLNKLLLNETSYKDNLESDNSNNLKIFLKDLFYICIPIIIIIGFIAIFFII